jgi:TonB family protein
MNQLLNNIMSVLKKNKIIILILLPLWMYCSSLIAQTSEFYINIECREVPIETAAYKRKVITDKMAERQTFYFITDYHLSGEIFMEAVSISPDLTVLDGKCTYYYKNGLKKTEGVFSENTPSGIWQYWSEDGIDSTIAEFDIFGKPIIISNTTRPIEDSYFTVEVTPEFPGGIKAMNKFLTQNIVYPKEALIRKIAGQVTIRFEVNKDGQIQNITALTRTGFGLEDEAIRVVSMMPRWIVPNLEGINLTVRETISITFRTP